MTIEEERFLIDIGGVVIRVEVGIELVLTGLHGMAGQGRMAAGTGPVADSNGDPTARDETHETQARQTPRPSQAQKRRATGRVSLA